MKVSIVKNPPQGMTCLGDTSQQDIANLLKGIASLDQLPSPWVSYGNDYFYGDLLALGFDYWVPIATQKDGYVELSGIIRYRLGTCGYCGESEGVKGYQECSNCGGA